MHTNYAGWNRLIRLVSDIEATLAADLQARHGIGLTEFRALEYLLAADDSELRMHDLANLLGLKQSSVTRLVDKLERLGLTSRDIYPNDKRGIYSAPTESGQSKINKVAPDYRQHLGATLSQHKLQNVVFGFRD